MKKEISYDHYDSSHKLLMLGDTGVGKTSLINSLVTNDFIEYHVPTEKIDFKIKTICTQDEQQIIKLLIWDSPSQKCYTDLTKDNIYLNSVGCMIVYSVTDRQSFFNVEKWLREIKTNDPTQTEILIVGNKSENSKHRAITYDEGRNLADSHGCKYIETSCKSGQNVENAFRLVAGDMISMVKSQSGRKMVYSDTKAV